MEKGLLGWYRAGALFFPALAFLAAISCSTMTVRDYKLDSSLLLENSTIKIAVVSDLHGTIFSGDQSVLIEKIIEANPDLILLTGDIFDDIAPMTGTILLLSAVSDIAPVYYVTGNHEYWYRDMREIYRVLKTYGVTVLSDEYKKINIQGNEIIIAGIDDPEKRYYVIPEYNQSRVMEKEFRELDTINGYKILMAHRPEKIKIYCKYPFDLVVSGHAHGGQVRIPYIINGLYAPHQGLFPRYAGGIYRHGNLTHIVSRGLSVRAALPRVFNPPELVVIAIESKKLH